MISDHEFAKKCMELVLEYSGKLDESVAEAQDRLTVEEFKAYRRAVGAVMGECFLEILRPIFRRHPELKPQGFDDET